MEAIPRAATTTLSALKGVEEVESSTNADGLMHFTVRPANGTSVIEQVSSAAREHGWTVEEMHVERGRLDEVFRSVTEIQES